MLLAPSICYRARQCQNIRVVFNSYSIASYSSDGKSDGTSKTTKARATAPTTSRKLSAEKLKLLDLLVERMPRSTLDIVKKVQMTKPGGHKQMQKESTISKLPEKKPRDIVNAARAVATQLESKAVGKVLLKSVGLNPKKISSAQTK